MKRLVVIALSAGFCVGAHAASAPEEKIDLDRTAAETAALFRVLMTAEDAPQACVYDTDWLDLAVPEDIARKYLGSTVHADLKPPSAERRQLHTQSMIDPDGKLPDFFCNDAKSTASAQTRFKEFEKDSSAHESVVRRTSFAPPVFDAGFDKAVVMIEYVEQKNIHVAERRADAKQDETWRLAPHFFWVAKIYAKSNDGWRFVDYEVVAQT